MKKLPIGIQSFENLIESNCLYVDKTREIYDLIQSGEVFFLSRPRRFGKSLLLSTLKSIFLGKKEHFNGLYIYNKIEWVEHPIIYIDFSKMAYQSKDELIMSLENFIDREADKYQISLKSKLFPNKFDELLFNLAKKRKVVVLIDEYDKPIVDYITNIERANENREILRNFYAVLKGSGDYIRFLFITGVSKFSKVSIFSGINNLWDITLDDKFATMFGYTQDELEYYFKENIEELANKEGMSKKELLKSIEKWYNGYSWDGKCRVYNPFSILRLFGSLRFGNYWFETGTPTFLVDFIRQKKVDVAELEIETATDYLFDSYDLENIEIVSLLFQTGYLTIDKIQKDEITCKRKYLLRYPNGEVSDSLLNYLFSDFTGERVSKVQVLHDDLKSALLKDEMDKFINIVQSILSGIPYNLHLQKEAYYHSLFYMILKLMGCDINLEVLTDKGRVDGVLKFKDKIYIIEFKLGNVKEAIKQIKNMKYYEKFQDEGKKIILLGIGFEEKKVEYLLEEMCKK